MNTSSVRKLIREVKKRPQLWDKSSKHYRKKNEEEEWEKIGDKLGLPADKVKTRWMSLRAKFASELRKIVLSRSQGPGSHEIFEYKGSWHFFSDLYFLKKVTKFPDVPDVERRKQKEAQEINGVRIIDLRESSSGPSLQVVQNGTREEPQEIDGIRIFDLRESSSGTSLKVVENGPLEKPQEINGIRIIDLREISTGKSLLNVENGTREDSQEINGVRIIDLRENSSGTNPQQPWSNQASSNITSNEFEPMHITADNEELSPAASIVECDSDEEDSDDESSKENPSNITEFQRQVLEIEIEKMLAFERKRQNEIEDEEMLFAKSLVPYLKKLEPIPKLRLKSKIQTLIANEISSNMGGLDSNGPS